ncbi:MAG: hypothetical protein QOJ00_542 [Actinomycetota bacterium]|jgi:hypothetical protein
MKGKWAAGIQPRNFFWVIKDRLAVSERPGGYGRSHRKVRRQEEMVWLRENGFSRVVSVLASPHNMAAYEDFGIPAANLPFGSHDDPREALPPIYEQIRGWLGQGERLLLHAEEVGDRLLGIVAGYLLWAGILESGPQTVTVIEHLAHRELTATGRELVSAVLEVARRPGSQV